MRLKIKGPWTWGGSGSGVRAYRESHERPHGAPGREWAGHIGLVYRSARVRDDTVEAFVAAGLRLGEQVVLATGDQDWESGSAQNGVDTARSARMVP